MEFFRNGFRGGVVLRLFTCAAVLLLMTACEKQPPLVQYSKYASGGAPQVNRIGIRAVPAEPFDQAMYDAADHVWGGRLYDSWWALQDGTVTPPPAETANTHPLWPTFNTRKSGATTWRCKSCHGWDYAGTAGAYGDPASDYYTQIKGIIPITGGGQPTLTAPADIYNFLHDGVVNEVGHGLGAELADDAAFYALTRFVVMMQEEAAQSRAPLNFIHQDTLLTTGSETNGAAFYDMPADGGCITCHGQHGKLLDFRDGDLATLPNQFVDTVARTNPQEALHKIRFGQPGSEPYMMGLEEVPAMVGQDIIQTAIDVVAFAQNGLVPSTTVFDYRLYQGDVASKPGTDFARGGILYDKWWTALDETSPLVTPAAIVDVNHSLWTPAATNPTPASGDATWRCKSCHGWDYAGVNGAYGLAGNAYETGIKGIISSNGVHPTHMEPVAIFDFLHSGSVVAPEDHAFVSHLSIEDVYALTRFVSRVQQEALSNMAPGNFIDLATGNIPNAKLSSGHALYDLDITVGGCEGCHGVDGTKIDFADNDPGIAPNEFLGDIAKANPWETLHKIRFGNPGSEMPGLTDYQDPMLNLETAVDALGFIHLVF